MAVEDVALSCTCIGRIVLLVLRLAGEHDMES